MNEPALTAVKLQTSNLSACESFFGTVFGFEVIHRYGGKPGEAFEEIVMTLGGRKGPMLKFIQLCDRQMLLRERPSRSRGSMLMRPSWQQQQRMRRSLWRRKTMSMPESAWR